MAGFHIGWQVPTGLWALALLASPAGALATPSNNEAGLTTRFENTVTTTVAQRLDDKAGSLAGYGYTSPSGATNVYDRGAFTPIRLDFLSEFEVDYGSIGLTTSAAGRAEALETSSTNGGSGLSCYPIFTASHRLVARNCEGSRSEIELREAFLHGSTILGKDQRLSYRVGRHTVIWGESVYFAGNGIAAGQAPIDTATIEKISGYQGQTVYLPVGQVSASWQPQSGIGIDLYYQFEWRRSRIGSAGTYTGPTNLPDAGGASTGEGPSYFTKGGERTPGSTDQYGLAFKWHYGGMDYGLYALSFDAKTPVLHFHPAVYEPAIGSYEEEFPTGIQIYGLSMAGNLGPAGFGAEISARRNMPLVTRGVVDVPRSGGYDDYPAGDTLHAQFSWSYVTPPLPGVPDGANWTTEVAMNRLLRTTANASQRSLDRTKTAAAFRTVFEPQFLQTFRRLDLSIPISVGYNLFGLSAVDPAMNRGTGDLSVGIVGTFDRVWKGAVTLTHYLGTAKDVFPYNFVTTGEPLARADFVSLSVQRTF